MKNISRTKDNFFLRTSITTFAKTGFMRKIEQNSITTFVDTLYGFQKHFSANNGLTIWVRKIDFCPQ
jgi:hypothetical protein